MMMQAIHANGKPCMLPFLEFPNMMTMLKKNLDVLTGYWVRISKNSLNASMLWMDACKPWGDDVHGWIACKPTV
jgi:hypothetical protein